MNQNRFDEMCFQKQQERKAAKKAEYKKKLKKKRLNKYGK